MLARLDYGRRKRDDVEADKRYSGCWRRPQLIGLAAVLAMFSAQVWRRRVKLAPHSVAVGTGHYFRCWLRRRRACVCGHAELRKQQRNEGDHNHTYTKETTSSHRCSGYSRQLGGIVQE